MTEAANGYIGTKLRAYRSKAAEAKQALAILWEATRLKDGKLEPLEITPELYEALAYPVQQFQDLAYGLDEAMATLSFYANPNTWEEVPAKTLAADDRGLKAKVALARIDPV